MLSAILILCVILLSGCSQGIEDEGRMNDTLGAVTTDTDAGDQSVRIAYYEQLVASLQEEVLAMKAELFATKTEYEKRLAELEAEDEEFRVKYAENVGKRKQ